VRDSALRSCSREIELVPSIATLDVEIVKNRYTIRLRREPDLSCLFKSGIVRLEERLSIKENLKVRILHDDP
jgi:hypothetical protein